MPKTLKDLLALASGKIQCPSSSSCFFLLSLVENAAPPFPLGIDRRNQEQVRQLLTFTERL